MRFAKGLSMLAIALLTLAALPKEAEATPTFARQANVSCTACHAHHIPILNDFGRQFKLSGYTISSDSGEQRLMNEPIADKMLSLPSIFNASIMTKTRYVQTFPKNESAVKVGDERGSFQMFDEAFIAIGGRIADNWGFNSEFTGDMASAKFVGAWPLMGGYGGVALFATDALGPFYGMELYNTGIFRPQRNFENRNHTNAAQVTSIGGTAASGVTLFHEANGLLLSGGIYTPTMFGHDGFDGENDSGIPAAFHYRATYGTNVGNAHAMVGLFGTSGSNTLGGEDDAGDPITVKYVTDGYGIDAQWLGTANDRSLLASAVFASTSGDEDSVFRNGASDTTAISADVSYQTTDRLFVKLAGLSYGAKDDKSKDFTAITPGLEYLVNINMRASLEYTMKSFSEDSDRDESQLYAMFYVAF